MPTTQIFCSSPKSGRWGSPLTPTARIHGFLYVVPCNTTDVAVWAFCSWIPGKIPNSLNLCCKYVSFSALTSRRPAYFLSVAKSGCELGHSSASPKLQQSSNWCRLANDRGKFLKFCFPARSLKYLWADSKAKQAVRVIGLKEP